MIEKNKLEMVREFLIGIKKESSEVFHEIRVLVDEIDEKPLSELIYKTEKNKIRDMELEVAKEKLRKLTNLIHYNPELKKDANELIDEIETESDVFLVSMFIKGALETQSEGCKTEKNKSIEESLNNIFPALNNNFLNGK